MFCVCECHRFQKLSQTATASTIPVAKVITSTGKVASVNGAKSLSVQRASSWVGRHVSVCVPTKDVPRVRFSTQRPASASVHARESADLHLHMITTVANVAVRNMQAVVSHHMYSTRISAHALAHKESHAQLVKHSTLVPASVNVQHRIQNANIRKFTITKVAHVNVQRL